MTDDELEDELKEGDEHRHCIFSPSRTSHRIHLHNVATSCSLMAQVRIGKVWESTDPRPPVFARWTSIKPR